MIYDNRDKITGYQKKFNELFEKKGCTMEYNDISGDFVIYDKDNELIGRFYDELNKDKDATDWKVAYNNLKDVLKTFED